MPSDAFVARLVEQIGNELAASRQYVQVAVHYEAETLPRLAAFFYAQSREERNHAMMMVRYLLDAGATPALPATPAPVAEFADIVAPVALALDQERQVSEQINGLAALAREEGDYTSEQFLQWFLKEQLEEVATMSDLLTVVTRARDNPLLAEEYLVREAVGDGGDDPTAPPVAGGAV
ncbi:MAG TPA: ferritin [Solirubrobacteraceae bacterium]|jgi:ferritin|nr:ferritin [Solirubrobacteraceae bacterium]